MDFGIYQEIIENHPHYCKDHLVMSRSKSTEILTWVWGQNKKFDVHFVFELWGYRSIWIVPDKKQRLMFSMRWP